MTRSSLRVAVDIGGTFTDVVIFDESIGRRSQEPRPLPRTFSRGVRCAGRLRNRSHRIDRPGPRHNRGDQRDHPAQRGVQTALVTTKGFPRRARDRPRQPSGYVQPSLPQAGTAGATSTSVRGRRTSAGRGDVEQQALDQGRLDVNRALSKRIRRSNRHLLSAFVCPSGP